MTGITVPIAIHITSTPIERNFKTYAITEDELEWLLAMGNKHAKRTAQRILDQSTPHVLRMAPATTPSETPADE